MKTEPLRILLADDDEADRFLFKEAFEEMEIEIDFQTVNDGVLLMDYLAVKDTSLPDFLFLDLNMPRKNGLTCLKEIRSNALFNQVPIAIYSTSVHEKDVEETFLNGANVYIKKPNNFSELLQVLKKAVMAVHTYVDSPFNRVNFLIQA
jgi:CheY-like chemotaxis protein